MPLADTGQTGLPAHSDRGLKGLLKLDWAYRLFSWLLSPASTADWLLHEHIKPFAGCRILDIGCGPASIAAKLPASVAEYRGVDMNPAYIAAAKLRWQGSNRFTFACEDAAQSSLRSERYDIVIASALLHHLDDAEAEHVVAAASAALAPGGRFVTIDCTYTDRQHWLARWLISKDRGRAVRTPAGYERLVAGHFGRVKSQVMHNLLRIPYTHFVMTCVKDAE